MCKTCVQSKGAEMLNQKILKLMEHRYPSNTEGATTLLIYSDESGMIIRLGMDNIRTPVYDIQPRLFEFSNLEELVKHLQS
jgi:hypothetical protein